jgi:hypothetical protein
MKTETKISLDKLLTDAEYSRKMRLWETYTVLPHFVKL